MSKVPGFRSGKAWKKVIATVGYLFIAIIVWSIATSGGSSTSSPATSQPAKATSVPVSSQATTPTASPSTPVSTPAPAVKTYPDGMYKIGTDMPAGEYVLIGSGSMSYFEVDKDSTGQMESILANDTFATRSIVSVKDSQYFKLTGCVAYTFSDAPKAQLTDGFLPAGMYKVGVDLPAGEYKVIPDGGTSYKEICKDSSHSMDSIVSNDIMQGESYTTVKAGQYLKLSSAKVKVE